MMAELFQKLTGKNELDLAPFDLTSNDEMSERNLVGKRLFQQLLIKILATH